MYYTYFSVSPYFVFLHFYLRYSPENNERKKPESRPRRSMDYLISCFCAPLPSSRTVAHPEGHFIGEGDSKIFKLSSSFDAENFQLFVLVGIVGQEMIRVHR